MEPTAQQPGGNGLTTPPAPAPPPAPASHPLDDLSPAHRAPPVATVPLVRRLPAPRLDPKKAFETVSSLEKAKGYLREAPILHARLTKTVEELEKLRAELDAVIATAKAKVSDFGQTVERVKANVSEWEKDQKEPKDAGSQPPSPAPVAAPADAR